MAKLKLTKTELKAQNDALKQYRNERRSIDYIILSNANIDPVKAPADASPSATLTEIVHCAVSDERDPGIPIQSNIDNWNGMHMVTVGH